MMYIPSWQECKESTYTNENIKSFLFDEASTNLDLYAFFQDLQTKVVLLEFWTYYCINYMRVVLYLAYLKNKYKQQLIKVVCVLETI
jgi:hypothetical protein